MKLVTFDRAMAPYNPGESRLVSDADAARLLDEGVLRDMSDFPPGADAVVVPVAKPRLSLPSRRQSYLTK